MHTCLTHLLDSNLRLAIYFLIGGSLTVLTIYLASLDRGIAAAFITTLPLQTVFTFILIYAEGEAMTVHDYAIGLLIFTPPWVCYIATVLLAEGRLGIFWSLGLGVLVYMVLSGMLNIFILGGKL